MIDTKQLRKDLNELSRSQRNDLFYQLLSGVSSKLHDTSINYQIRDELDSVIKRTLARKQRRIGNNSMIKLYIAHEADANELNHWTFRGKQAYRSKNSKYVRKYSRRPSIYGWSGELMPRTFLDKFYPRWIKTQHDYDRYMEQKYKMTRYDYIRKYNP